MASTSPAGIGHNQDPEAKKYLAAVIDRIEHLEGEKQDIAADIREVYNEAKGRGFDTKALREIIKLRKKSKEEREEMEYVLHCYMLALGMVDEEDE